MQILPSGSRFRPWSEIEDCSPLILGFDPQRNQCTCSSVVERSVCRAGKSGVRAPAGVLVAVLFPDNQGLRDYDATVIKRLNQFVQDAAQLDWPDFKDKHGYHVVVIIAPEDDDGFDPASTCESLGTVDTRPRVNDNYRVGVLGRSSQPGDPDLFTVGRGRENDISIQDIAVSKEHARFERTEDGWALVDNGSTNGTYLGESRLPAHTQVVVRSSESIKISPAVSAVFFGPGDFYQFLRTTEVREAFE